MTMYDLEDKYDQLLRKTHAYLIYAPKQVKDELGKIIDQATNFYHRNCTDDFMQVYFETVQYISDIEKDLDINTKDKIYVFNRNQSTLVEDIDGIRRMILEMQDRHEKDRKELKELRSMICAPIGVVVDSSRMDHDNLDVKPKQKETYEELIIRKLGNSKKSVNEIMELTGLDYDKARKAVTRLFRKGLLTRDTFNGELKYYVKQK